MTISEEQTWAAKEKQWRTVIFPSYKFLLENSAEENNTQFRKESKAQDFSVVVAFIKKKEKSLKLAWRNIYNYVKTVTTTIQKVKHYQGGNKQDNKTIWFEFWTNYFYRPAQQWNFLLRQKIKLGVLVILLHCTSHLNYSTFKNI